MSAAGEGFWDHKSLEELDEAEWESLCDGCGKCCLNKLHDVETGELFFTNVACRLLDIGKCRCTRYAERSRLVPDCVRLSKDNIQELNWMPSTCAYRLVAEGKPLYWWHPLVSGDPDSVHQAGVSVRRMAITERRAGPLEHHILDREP